MEEDPIIISVLFGVILWTSLFLLIRRALPKCSFDFCNRLVSTIRASLAVILASLSVQDWSCPVCPVASTSSPKQMWSSACLKAQENVRLLILLPIFDTGSVIALLYLSYSLRRKALAMTEAYLIYDFVCCLFDKQVKIDNLIHHLVSIVGIGAGLAYNLCGSEMVATMWITEISSPFLHLRELLKELGYRDTDLNFAADVLFAVTFSMARMIGGPYLCYVTLSAENPIIIKAMALGLQLVSAFWFYKIVRMLMYKLSRRTKSATLHLS